MSRFTVYQMGRRWDNLLHSPLELAAGEHNAPPTAQAAYSDIGTDAGYLPFVPAAGMGLAHTHPVADAYLKRCLVHSFCFRPFLRPQRPILTAHAQLCKLAPARNTDSPATDTAEPLVYRGGNEHLVPCSKGIPSTDSGQAARSPSEASFSLRKAGV
jgi:hypothetical protein